MNCGDLCNGPLSPSDRTSYLRASTFNFTNIGIEIAANINEINNEICNGAVAGGEGEAVVTHLFTIQIGLINGLFGYVIGALLGALIATIVFEFLSGVYGYCFDFKFDLIGGLTATAVAIAVSIILGFLNGIIGFICAVLIQTVVAATVEYKFEDVLTPGATRIKFNKYGTAVPLAPVDIVLKFVEREREEGLTPPANWPLI